MRQVLKALQVSFQAQVLLWAQAFQAAQAEAQEAQNQRALHHTRCQSCLQVILPSNLISRIMVQAKSSQSRTTATSTENTGCLISLMTYSRNPGKKGKNMEYDTKRGLILTAVMLLVIILVFVVG